jgi:ectoine hydroxylase-related dioxygenase (phytanoyl-CoA dioxygenase family)
MHSQLYKHFGVGHSQICWDLRQNEKIINVFSNLWNCNNDDLFVSFDGFSFGLPPEITNKGWEHKTWFHTDQSYLRNDFECIQSWITANDIEEGDGTLAIMEGSHNYHKEFQKKFNINDSNDWYKLNSIEEKFYFDKNCKYKKIKCPKGSLVLWDSRTIHYGANPVKNRKNHNFRSVVYLCYMKKDLCSYKDIIKKQNLFNKKQTTNHWPCNPKPNPKYPNTYGNKLPDITEIKDPIITPFSLKFGTIIQVN